MLRFDAYRDEAPVKNLDLAGAYVFGQSSVPVRAELTCRDGQISVNKRIPGACGLSLLWQAGDSGKYLLATTRLPDRAEPYNLSVELARAQIMRITQKQEDWGLFDYADAKDVNEKFRRIRREFIESLKADDPAKAAALADKALADAITLAEKIALFHAEIFLSRRRASRQAVARTGFGCMADLSPTTDQYRERLTEAFDFVSVPTPWKQTEPKEGQYKYDEIDAWIKWAVAAKKPIHAGPLLSFAQAHLPEWLYIWEHDYDALRELIYEHVQQMVQRYKKQVRLWRVVAGIHAQNSFNLTFEQLMELTRMSCLLVKQASPRSKVLIDLDLPWGEYYARNQRTIPPILYAEMAVQSGIKFDCFGLRVHMGVPVDGHYVRDLMQVSSLLDEFMKFSKNVHITACQVPSGVATDVRDAWGGAKPVPAAGQWHAPWSERLQADWLRAFYRIAISKPFVDTICWRDLADLQGHYVSHGGLCDENLDPKLSYKELRNFRAYLTSSSPQAAEGPQREADSTK